jgi:hypothetical protein
MKTINHKEMTPTQWLCKDHYCINHKAWPNKPKISRIEKTLHIHSSGPYAYTYIIYIWTRDL